MKNLNLFMAMFIVFVTTTFFSCSKELLESRKEILIKTNWRELSFQSNGLLMLPNSCEEDDKYIFSEAGILYIEPGLLACGYPKYEMPWRLSKNASILYTGLDDGKDEPWEVLELDESMLKIRYFDAVDSALQILTLIPY